MFHGRLPEFSGASEDWSVFAEQLTHYFTASGISDTAKRRAVLLSTCGTPTYELIKTLTAPADVTTKTFAELVQLVQITAEPPSSQALCHHTTVRVQHLRPSARRGNIVLCDAAAGYRLRLQLRRFDQRTHTRSPRLRHPR